VLTVPRAHINDARETERQEMQSTVMTLIRQRAAHQRLSAACLRGRNWFGRFVITASRRPLSLPEPAVSSSNSSSKIAFVEVEREVEVPPCDVAAPCAEPRLSVRA